MRIGLTAQNVPDHNAVEAMSGTGDEWDLMIHAAIESRERIHAMVLEAQAISHQLVSSPIVNGKLVKSWATELPRTCTRASANGPTTVKNVAR